MEKRFLSIDETARYVGLSRQGIWKQVVNGTLPSLRVGSTHAIAAQHVVKLRQTRINELERKLRELRN